MEILKPGFICLLLSILPYLSRAKKLICGFPGTPAYGGLKSEDFKAAYYEGEVVAYTCRIGYILLGSPIRRCTEKGTWTEEIPICDDSMTTLGVADSTPTIPGHPAELAIDMDKRTCTYLKPKSHRWWRIDLGQVHKVLSVALTINDQDKNLKFTVFVIKYQDPDNNIYKRCASFSGKFGTQTIVLSCAEGRGIEGRRIHIEDHLQTDGFFELCEVEVQVEKDTGYDCGLPPRRLYSVTSEISDGIVEYGCIRGYELRENNHISTCQNDGQWSLEPPICDPIICDDLEPLEHGYTEIKRILVDTTYATSATTTPDFETEDTGPPLEGATAVYQCNHGYKLVGSFTRYCLKDGSWSGKAPQCKAIRCPIPDGKDIGGIYRLLNKTNSMGSMAMLRCKGGKRVGDNPYIICTESGEWTPPTAHCVLPPRAAHERRVKDEPRIVNQGAIIFGMVVAAVMIVIVLVALYLYGLKRNGNKPELPSRATDPPVPPPRPPPRAKSGALKNAFMGFMNRDSSDKPEDSKDAWKTQSLPTNQTNDPDAKYSPKRALSYGETLPEGQDEPAVIEVEVLPQVQPRKRGKYAPVPEENEDVSLENVVLNLSDKGSSAKEPKKSEGSDYAAVDYEKKRQSRLLKEQDSIESSSTAGASPLPTDEPEKKSPTPKQTSPSETEEESEEEEEDDAEAKKEEERKAKEEEERKAREEEERKAKEEEERKAKEEEEKKAKEEAAKKAKEEEEKKAVEAPGQRRRRLRDEPPPPAVEDKPVLRRFRKY